MPPGKRKGPSSSSKRGRSELDKLAAASDSDNELEDGLLQMHDGTAAADSDELGGFDEEAVYGLDDDDSDEEDESEEDEEDDEDVLEEALLRGGKQAQLAKQAQYLQQKLKLQQREDESDEDEEGGDDEQQRQRQQRGEQTLGDKLWGANKRAYYQAEDAEVDSDDALAQEEQEARQLQAAQAAALDDDDYALPGLDAAAAAGGDDAGDGPVSLAAAAAGGGGVEVETVATDVEGLTSEQQAAVVMSDAPELLSLLAELRDSLAEVRGRIGPLLREVSTGGLATSAGLSYLEAKHLLLLQYCMCIVAYLLIKAEGRSVVGHPVLHRLAQLRVYIEKIRPIDKQLSYQVDKLLRATAKVQASADSDAAAAAAGEQQQDGAAAAAAGGGGDALQYRPNPQALISKVPLVGDTAGLSAEAAATGGVYRPPKLNPVAMPEDRAVSNKEMRQIREAQRRAQRSAVMRELAQELAGAPEEVGAELPGMDTAAAVAARQRLEARAAAEEELMLRVPLSKAEAKKLKAQRRAGLSGAVGLTDFADDVADLVATSTAAEGGSGGAGGGLSELFGKHKLSQRYGADLSAQQQSQIRSGDADVELRKPLHERRAVFDAVAARRAAAAAAGGADTMDMGGGGGGYGDDEYDYEAGIGGRGGKGMGSSGSGSGGKKRQRDGFGGGQEDEFYTAAKAGRASSKAAKAAAHAVPTHLEPPLPEPEAVGQRKISYEIEKNRGLTPHRRKDLKNPRKKHRVKFAQAVVRRKGQVQGMQQAPSSARGYAGEATGIKSRVAKSTRLG